MWGAKPTTLLEDTSHQHKVKSRTKGRRRYVAPDAPAAPGALGRKRGFGGREIQPQLYNHRASPPRRGAPAGGQLRSSQGGLAAGAARSRPTSRMPASQSTVARIRSTTTAGVISPSPL